MTVLITLTTAGIDAGPFDLYSNVDGYTTAFETGVSKSALVAGYTSNLVPNSTITVRVRSTGVCTNFIDIPIGGITTTTSSTSVNPCANCVNHDVTIGSQIWTGCNLDVTTYRNGDVIPQVSNPTQWANLTTGAWCYYNNDPANGAVYGKLYNWYAVNDARGLAPTGWHIPTDVEWLTLITTLGGEPVAGGKMKVAGTTRWSTPNTAAINSSGFAGLPGGIRSDLGTFVNVGLGGYLWSSTEANLSNAWFRLLDYDYGSLVTYNYFKQIGLSVRCVRD
jgi:uncharacterized protein (TIGR02145 family)